MMQSQRWTTVQESEFPWEREALAYLRQILPDADPFRAWSNFEFIADDGSINEVDLLVVSLYRIFLVEIKSAPGRVEGDAGSWTWSDGGRTRTIDNPLLLANRKAKKLKSLLQRQHAFNRERVPYVEAIVFLSNTNVRCRLDGSARSGVYLRSETEPVGYPDIAQTLKGERDIAGGYGVPTSRIEAATSRAVARGLEQAGIRAAQSHRQVGDYVLEGLLNETDVFQDWEARHVRFEKSRRRIRIYPNALESSETTRGERQRAAEREYRLLDGVVHSGILRAEGFTEHERGPAIIFEHPTDAERLDFFLQNRLKELDLRGRLTLLRQIAETVQYAHSRRLHHQTLTPQSILVVPPESNQPSAIPSIRIFNWQAGHSELSTEGSTRLTVHHILKLGLAGETQGAVYLAPELYSVGALDPARMDIFSLGALAYHIIGGVPPAPSVEELHERLKRTNGLLLSDVFDGIDEDLEANVQLATAPDTSDRPEIDVFLTWLDQAIANLGSSDREQFVHPLDASRNDQLEHGFIVRQRLGKGSTALALLVERDGKEGVLKVALKQEYNERLVQEAEVLRQLRHQNVVQLYEALELSGHVALFMETAGVRSSDDRSGTYTLAQRIREEGRLSLDLLQRFGEELLNVVDWLEQKGISHRDIKPDNIGIGQTPRRTLTLILFDFSLSGTPAEQIRAGTPPYLDPFLSSRKPPRWDPYAERFAAAVTLYEMATGQLPQWGDGRSNPALIDDEVTLDSELFDPAVRDDLTRFFRKALAREYGKRFDNAEEMRRAWQRLFEQIDQPSTISTDPDQLDMEGALVEATEQTALASLPLSPRVLNALERMGVHTLRELQELPRIRLYRNKGIGQRTVKQIRELAEKVARHFADRSGVVPLGESAIAAEADPKVDPRFWSIDLIYRRLLPMQSAQDDPDSITILRGLLGMEHLGGRAVSWPAQQDVAEGLSYPREDVRQVIERARDRWTKDKPAWLGPLRDDIAVLLEKHGGVMTCSELVAALLVARGSAAPESERDRNAAAVAYAAVEVEASRESARYILYRGRQHVFLVATQALGDAFAATPATRARYAEALGEKADRIAEEDPLLSPERVVAELTEVIPPEGERPLSTERLVRLAVSASSRAALSSRMELYPQGMPATRALKLGAGSLLGPRKLSADGVQSRIASRYPDAEGLPGRPMLDALLEESGLPLQWDVTEGKYLAPATRQGYMPSSSTASRHTPSLVQEDSPESDEALALDHRLASVRTQRRLLVLTVTPDQYLRAQQAIVQRCEVTAINLESLLLRHLHAVANSLKVRWDVILRADAADRTSRDWRKLQQVVERAITAVEEELLSITEPALLIFPGLLARYDRLDLFERLRHACSEGRAPGYILLIPADTRSDMPVIDRVALPVVHASEWGRIPPAWLFLRREASVSVGAEPALSSSKGLQPAQV